MPDYTPIKRCTKCNKDLPATAEYFSKQRGGKLGMRAACKDCLSRQAGYKQRIIRKPVPNGMRRCGVCRAVKPSTREYFTVNPNGKDGLQNFCKSCGAEQQRRYRARYPERVRKVEEKRDRETRREQGKRRRIVNQDRIREQKREYARRHPEVIRAAAQRNRARRAQAEGEYTADDLKRAYKVQRGKCWWCGKKLDGKYEADHRIPLSRGGTNYPDNIVVSCRFCNRSKHDKMPWEWAGKLL